MNIFSNTWQRQAGHTSHSMYHLHISLTVRVWCPVEEEIDFFSFFFFNMVNKSQCYHQEQKNQYLPIQEKTLRKQQSNVVQAILFFFTCTSETSIWYSCVNVEIRFFKWPVEYWAIYAQKCQLTKISVLITIINEILTSFLTPLMWTTPIVLNAHTAFKTAGPTAL